MTAETPTTRWAVTIDCRSIALLLPFWRAALGYVDAAPPAGWSSWRAWLIDNGVPEEQWGDGGSMVELAGDRPALNFLVVPESKTVKNRLHLDVVVSGGRAADQTERARLIEAKVSELTTLGGRVLARLDGPRGLDHVVMAAPEGNELCVV